MSKLAVAFINHKGGVGKTTLAHIMTQIGLSDGLAITAVDLDPQRNLTDSLTLSLNLTTGMPLKITNQITDEGDLIVIDCPPALHDVTAAAVDFADITLIPILPDMFSISNLGLVYKFGEQRDKSPEQLAIIKVGFDKRALVEMVKMSLEAREYKIAGEVPISKLIPYNITVGRQWDHRMQMITRWPYSKLYHKIWSAYKSMLNGEFENAWED